MSIQGDSPEESQISPEKPPKPLCANCGISMPRKSKFCPSCGQKTTDVKISMRDLMLKLWQTTFHLENKFIKMLAHLLIPGKVTIELLRGRVKRYPHPVIAFLWTMFFFLFFTNLRRNAEPEDKSFLRLGDGIDHAQEKKEFIAFRDTLLAEFDSLPTNLKYPSNKIFLDSILERGRKKLDIPTATDSTDLQLFDFIPHNPVKVAVNDILFMHTDSLLQAYRVTGTIDRMAVSRDMKITKEGEGAGDFWIGTASWAVFMLTFIMSLWMKLLYRRSKRFLVEHFILWIHLHTAFFFLLSVLMALRYWYGSVSDYIEVIPFLWLWLGSFIAMYKYYKQSIIKTLIKWILMQICYLLSFIIAILGSVLVTLLLF